MALQSLFGLVVGLVLLVVGFAIYRIAEYWLRYRSLHSLPWVMPDYYFPSLHDHEPGHMNRVQIASLAYVCSFLSQIAWCDGSNQWFIC